jgi:SpoVK/Ycf46/Vps4 family AAA+-type ATPase
LNGSYDAVEQTYNRLNDYNINNKKTLLYWCFKSKDNIEFVKFPLTTNSPIRSEFYPWLGKENVNDYIDRFENSNSNILILLGEPGTGKTSFIRHLITRTNQHCFTTYDEEVMQQDQLYVKFLSEDVRYLILEDADLLLTDRINTGNRVMSKMLNAADGLVSFNDKKIIFTANIRDKAKIDEALVRKGRCFDVVEFEAMSPEQTVNAAKAAGLDFI